MSSRHFPIEVVKYLRTALPKLNIDYPNTFDLTQGMLDNINYGYVNPTEDCIVVNDVGMNKRTLQLVIYHISIKIHQFKTNDILFSQFVNNCRGIYNVLKSMHGNTYNDYYVSDIVDINTVSVRPDRPDNKSFTSEILLSYRIDMQGVDGEYFD